MTTLTAGERFAGHRTVTRSRRLRWVRRARVRRGRARRALGLVRVAVLGLGAAIGMCALYAGTLLNAASLVGTIGLGVVVMLAVAWWA